MLAALTSFSRSTWISIASVAIAFCTSMALGIVLFDHAPAPDAATPIPAMTASAAPPATSTPATSTPATSTPATSTPATSTEAVSTQAPASASTPATAPAPDTTPAPATTPATTAAAPQADTPAADLDGRDVFAKAQVAAEYARLKVPARQAGAAFETPSETAQHLREALRRDDFATASKIAQTTLAASKVRGWSFAPFATVASLTADLIDPAFEKHLDGWVAAAPKSALPLIFRAEYHFDLGWARRGINLSHLVGRDNMRSFDAEMSLAQDDVQAALARDPSNPTALAQMLSILHGQGMSQAMVDAFMAAIKQQPDYYSLYSIMLDVLEPKWGGAVENMRAFVKTYADPAPASSPLKLLYLELYAHTLSISLDHCWQAAKPQPCVAEMMEKLVTPEMKTGLKQALALYDLADPSPAGHYRFGQAVEPIMKGAMERPDGAFYAGGLLQLLATAMHSDTSISAERMTAAPDMPGETGLPASEMDMATAPAGPAPGTASGAAPGTAPRTTPGTAAAHNDYIIDKLLARSWYQKGFYANALVKTQDALNDIAATDFARETDRDQALTGVYLRLSETERAMMQIAAAVAAAEAADKMGGINGLEELACNGYRNMRAVKTALDACRMAITRNPNNMAARYYQAMLESELDQKDAALADYQPVADSHDPRSVAAVFGMTRIYFARQQNQDALDLLNSHQEIFDERLTNPGLMAQAYDMRCNAQMQLGKLTEALVDCQRSLQHGNLPEAFRKEQELVQRIAQSKT